MNTASRPQEGLPPARPANILQGVLNLEIEFQCALRPRKQSGLDMRAAAETISPIDKE